MNLADHPPIEDSHAPHLSIVVPARNESIRLPATIDRLRHFLTEHGSAELVLAVDTGSEDETIAIAKSLAVEDPRVRVTEVLSTGKGYSVLAGVEASRGDIILTADADLAVDASAFADLISVAEEGAIGIASRSLSASRRVGEPLSRFVLGRAFNLVVRALILPGIRDTQCGFKAFPRETGLDLLRRLSARGWVFDVEFLALARREGLEIREIPVTWRYGHGSTMKLARDARGVVEELREVRRRMGRVPEPKSAK